MTPAQALLLMQCRADVPDQQCYEAISVLAEAVECARVVGVLNAWAMRAEGRESRCVELFPGGEGWVVILKFRVNPSKDEEHWCAACETPTLAYAVAAKAIEAGGLG